MPSPPAAGQLQPPVGRGGAGVGIVEHRPHDTPSPGRAGRLRQPRQLLHMPEVVAVEIGLALASPAGGTARCARPPALRLPAVGAIGGGVAADSRAAPRSRSSSAPISTPRACGRLRRGDGGVQRGLASRRDRRVLLAQQPLRLGAPRQQSRRPGRPNPSRSAPRSRRRRARRRAASSSARSSASSSKKRRPVRV